MISPSEFNSSLLPLSYGESLSTVDRLTLMSEPARVVSLFSGGAWVIIEPRLFCHGCAAKQGCGTGLLARWQGKRSRQLAVKSEIPLAAGQRIRIAVPSTYFLWSVLLAYMLPLMSAVSAGVLAELLLVQGHWGVPVAFLTGLAAGIGLLKCYSSRLSRWLRLRVIDI